MTGSHPLLIRHENAQVLSLKVLKVVKFMYEYSVYFDFSNREVHQSNILVSEDDVNHSFDTIP